MNDEEQQKRFLAYEILKNRMEIEDIRRTNLSPELRDNLADTWSITGETFSKDLLVKFIMDAKEKWQDVVGLSEAEIVRRGIDTAYNFLRNMKLGYAELEGEFKG